MNVLVIAPHPDDESIGCGGAVCLHSIAGDRVSVAFLTSGEQGLKHLPTDQAKSLREHEARAAAEILGVSSIHFLRAPDWHLLDTVESTAAALKPILQRESPHRIYLPHPQEWHPDHQACLPIVCAALGERETHPTLLGYEVWTPMSHYNDGIDMTSVLPQKLEAIRCHQSQVQQLAYDRGVEGLNQYRGAIAWGCAYAEVFRHLFVPGPAKEGVT